MNLNIKQTIALTGVVFSVLAINLVIAAISTSSLRWLTLYVGVPVAGVALALMLVYLTVRLVRRT